ncbi:hypothetical protein [Novosphingobium terrae]|uniref:hypothetical protein n=1 Tax=Novosphingobium terrae TaxID=2726189 RepID=UPI00197E5500|nr:hypothetical protein [Novosphingobium terrae]
MYEWNTRNGMATYKRKGEGETLIINRDVSGFDEAYLGDLRNQPVWPHLLTMAESLGDEMAAINAFPPRYESYDALGAITTLIIGAMSEDHGFTAQHSAGLRKPCRKPMWRPCKARAILPMSMIPPP